MELSHQEEKALRGDFGESQRIAHRILLAVGKLTDADRLVGIRHAHVSGVSYLTIGKYGSEFLSKFSRTARVKVFTTVNPCGIDIEARNAIGLDAKYISNQMEIIESYKRMGVEADSFTCIPYECFDIPPRGSRVAWAESSAAIYANSILGLRTNRESSLSSLAAAVTGKTPHSGLHLDENREPKVIVSVDKKIGLDGSVDFGVLGYFAGVNTQGETIGFEGISRESVAFEEAKALSASIGTSGSAGMFTFLDKGNGDCERIDFSRKEYEDTLSDLSTNAQPDAVVFGCPQLTVQEFSKLARSLSNRKVRSGMACVAFTSRRALKEAMKLGYPSVVKRAGVKIFADACADFSPLVGKLGADTVVTDSCKGAHYMKRVHHLNVCVEPTESIIRKYTSPT